MCEGKEATWVGGKDTMEPLDHFSGVVAGGDDGPARVDGLMSFGKEVNSARAWDTDS